MVGLFILYCFHFSSKTKVSAVSVCEVVLSVSVPAGLVPLCELSAEFFCAEFFCVRVFGS